MTAARTAPLELDAVRGCLVGSGTMLPAPAYTDEAVLAWERRVLFAGGWVCVGRGTELAAPRTRRAVRVGDDTVLLVRGEDGQLRGFYNTCRHRGHELLPCDSTAAGRFIACPYHSWVYALDGSLHKVPTAHRASVEAEGHGLIAVAVEEWQGFVFVNAGGEAPPVRSYFDGLDDLLAPYECDRLLVAASHSYDLAANWKLAVENYHECYHCSTIHPELCRVSSPESGASFLPDGLWLGGSMELVSGANTMALDGHSGGVPMRGLTDERLREVLYLQLVPNLLVSVHPDYVLTHLLEPVAADRTRVDCQWLFPPEATQRPDFDPSYAVDFWDITNRQDWAACEGVQRGVSSRGYRPGPLSPWHEAVVFQAIAVVAHSYLDGRLPATANLAANLNGNLIANLIGNRPGKVTPMSGIASATDLDRLDDLILDQEKIFLARTGESQRVRQECSDVLPGGVASNWQDAPPGAVWIDHGAGSRVFDVDGTEYVDMHGGFGVGIVGHAHPAVVTAVSERVRRGTHFAQPTGDTVVVARELARRFGLPMWRYNNSGTESTMDAVHLMRVATGRSKIIKVEGTYHGHHDSVQVSVYPSTEDAGPADRPNSVRVGTAVPPEIARLTLVVPFGDLAAVERQLIENPGEIAGMVIEPIMMNIGLIPPPPDYLAGLRDLLHAHGAYLAFDEVKTGLAVAPGGAVEWSGVTPDLVCLAKALGGGVPCGAIGGTPELMGLIAEGRYEQVGTFNGNPLTMAAARAVLTEILTDHAYAHFETLRGAMVAGAEEILRRYELPGHVRAYGAKGAVIFHDRLRNYRDFLEYPDQWGNAHWLYQHNGGVFLPPWGKCEQWTVSVQHTLDDVARFVANLERMAVDIRADR